MQNTIDWLNDITKVQLGAVAERARELIYINDNIKFERTPPGGTADTQAHVDFITEYGTSDTKAPRTGPNGMYRFLSDDITLEFTNRYGDKGSLFGQEDYLDYFTVNGTTISLWTFRRQELETWVRHNSATTSSDSHYRLNKSGKSEIMAVPIEDLTRWREGIGYTHHCDVAKYFEAVRKEIDENGWEYLKPFVAPKKWKFLVAK